MTAYEITDEQIKTLVDCLINFESKRFFETVDEVKAKPILPMRRNCHSE
jgi:hypothetical protein